MNATIECVSDITNSLESIRTVEIFMAPPGKISEQLTAYATAMTKTHFVLHSSFEFVPSVIPCWVDLTLMTGFLISTEN